MAEAVPGDAPAYEGPSIPDVEEATAAMAAVTIAAPTVTAHTPGVGVTHPAPAVMAEPPLPTPRPLVGTGKHAGDQAMVATPVAPEGPPGLFDAEMDFIRVFENLTESVKMDDMVAVYEKRDQQELDAAVAKIKNHASLPHFEAYITRLKNCEGVPGLYEFGTEDQIQECASFEL